MNVWYRAYRIFPLLFLSSMTVAGANPFGTYDNSMLAHSVHGPYPFVLERDYDSPPSKRISFELVPYYSTASGAKNGKGEKVPEGDRLGRWNMIGLLHGTQASPNGALDNTSTPSLFIASQLLQPNNASKNYTDETNSDSTQTFGFLSVPVDHEKFGLNTRLFVNLGLGFHLQVRGGFVHFKQNPDFVDKSRSSLDQGFTSGDVTIVERYLTDKDTLPGIADEINLDLSKIERFDFTDTVVDLSWAGRYAMDGEESKRIVEVVPYVSAGVLLPTGKEKSQDKAFDLATGSDGFYGLNGMLSLEFDFPNMINFGFGGNATYFFSRTQSGVRMPTSQTQSSIYPWTINAKREPGVLWGLYGQISSQNFIEKLSGYLTYAYVRQEKESVSLKDTATRNGYFKPRQYEKETEWEAQSVHAALEYEITKDLILGGAVQTYITGRRIFRLTSLLGSVKFKF